MILIFGPQDLSFDKDFAKELRTTLLESSSLQWIVQALLELPQHWESLEDAISGLQDSAGKKHLRALVDWIRLGDLPDELYPLPNVLLTPLVVILQLMQYSSLVKQLYPDIAPDEQLPYLGSRRTETVGLCTGLLSAAAVASSESLQKLASHGAVAIRLAMALGAVADAGDHHTDSTEGHWRSFAVAWHSPDASVEFTKAIDACPEAYISVLSGERQATITVREKSLVSLVAQLRAAGLTVAETTLRGAFHFENRLERTAYLIKFLDSNMKFHFPSTSFLPCKALDAKGIEYVDGKRLHSSVTQAVLFEQADWWQLHTTLDLSVSQRQPLVVAFGRERCVPQWFARKLGPRFMHIKDTGGAVQIHIPFDRLRHLPANDPIAVVGMACNFPGGGDLDEYWSTILSGSSQHASVTENRVNFRTAAWRETDPQRKWYGNFIQDPDVFDHKFFKKSPREAASTDPQQRLIMQLAYQALEQSGYFSMPSSKPDIGCFIGVGLSDYENNVACYPPTAYTATGNLRSFVAGKVSHFFGWLGPSITVDTACSSSAVAVHNACQSILSGDCSAAIAGGTNLMTGPEWYQNLDGASFLSPTGQCKPFDEKADGYCRGEGAGVVFLKKLSSAIKDGNQVFGVINATAVFQNENCSVITAPSGDSLADLFSAVTRKAGLDPRQISVVEAHGTGTQVGDRAEYHGVRKVFGGPNRDDILSLGSVKGLIGHAENASGIAALIKVLLMIHQQTIPPQASHSTLNQKLGPLPTDNIEVFKTKRSWLTAFKAALINNYGASGSNASMIVSQPPAMSMPDGASLPKAPFWLSAFDHKGLKRLSTRLSQFLRSRPQDDPRFSVANLSFQIFRQSNRSLGGAFVFSCATTEELEEKLLEFGSQGEQASTQPRKPPSRPVIFCFGGQVSTFIGLDRNLFDQSQILRSYIDEINGISMELGLESLYPAIFSTSPTEDVVLLQTMQFALQYASSKSWIHSGIKPTALVGHSFGELTALCVSGVLSVEHAVEMIAKRARIIQAFWGADKGIMAAVEGDITIIQQLLQANRTTNGVGESLSPNIACFNGPRSFTLAGKSEDMDALQELAASDASFSSLRIRQLNVTNAFHSSLVDPLMPDLATVAENCIFRDASIEHERATKDRHTGQLTREFAARHLRDPVYFDHAVHRLAEKYPSSIWLEAGSNSGVTNMAKRALNSPNSCYFQPVNLTSAGALSHLVDATTGLWKEGLDFTFWLHHVKQSKSYAPLLLPPYQFDKSRHWLERTEPPKQLIQEVNSSPQEIPQGLWSFLGYQNSTQTHARFRINTNLKEYQEYVRGHIIAQIAAICPSALQHAIALGTITELVTGEEALEPDLQAMKNHVPMCLDESRVFWLDAEKTQQNPVTWEWSITSTKLDEATANKVHHVSGRVVFRNPSLVSLDFERYERLVDYQRCLSLLTGSEADQIIQGGNNIYRIFLPIVNYQFKEYKRLNKIVSRPGVSAGRVMRSKQNPASDIATNEAFCQVAGIYLNCMINSEDGEMYLANKVDQWIQAQNVKSDSKPDSWNVYVLHHERSSKEHVSDIFVFDPISRKLTCMILGLHFVKVTRPGISKLLTKLSGGCAPVEVAQKVEFKESEQGQQEMSPRVRGILCKLLGLVVDDIKPSSDLIELGVDSLLVMEVAREIEDEFSTKLAMDDLMELTDFQSLVDAVHSKLGISRCSTASEKSWSQDQSSEVGVESSASSVTENDVNDLATEQEEKEGKGSAALSSSAILDTFTNIKQSTDEFVTENKLTGYSTHVQPKLTEMCIIYIVDAFEKLGSPIRTARENQVLDRVAYLLKHEKVVRVFYNLLAEAGLIGLQGGRAIRTSLPVPNKPAATLQAELIYDHPEHAFDFNLTSLTGSKLADCLSGKTEGIQLIMSKEGREHLAGWYQKAPVNATWINQLERLLSQLFSNLPTRKDPINVLEVGAGTGGTTSKLVSTLAALDIPFCYTATDISGSLVAGLRKRFKHHPFMRFETLDVEKPPSPELMHNQHIVLATNCVHATHDLTASMKNIHKLLTPDGFLVLLEMTEIVPWVDLVWGLVEGWWLANDGRQHALCSVEVWQDSLRASGFGHIDWTNGDLPESSIQRLIVAFASSPDSQSLVSIPSELPHESTIEADPRQAVVDSYVDRHANPAMVLDAPTNLTRTSLLGRSVLVTGATGSLGSHIVAYFATRPEVREVVCLNRISSKNAVDRQYQALASRGLSLSAESWAKVRVYEAETYKPSLGMTIGDYQELTQSVTDIVHNAWPMSLKRSIKGFEQQFEVMANLIAFARGCASLCGATEPKIGFQFISSIAVVGHHPFVSGRAVVPEERMAVVSAPPIGYAEAKLVCENMLKETLHRQPRSFKPVTVRLGQIAGSKTDGFWNPDEHIALLLKSSQTLNVLPNLDGTLSWCPVNDMAATLGELLLKPTHAYPIYHIENPQRQSWREMIRVLAELLDISKDNIIPFPEWVRRVRHSPSVTVSENPAVRIGDFFDVDFVRMSCGGLVLDTQHSVEHSETLRELRPVSRDIVERYVQKWRDDGFLR
ncbi:putative polyketide synthase [Lentithecium fluviatile CBS 122367]|uniref:Putative polyketide synthase n=1 Tax=Lentithecium fluviatile CBS 122367 TaxID=1168545 RepID=A0A6G1J6P9_9PLEO|nr:putative polyketide synthase [Lentithecium fluviatile CBS 122367]